MICRFAADPKLELYMFISILGVYFVTALIGPAFARNVAQMRVPAFPFFLGAKAGN